MLYDGDCGFCQYWIERWQNLTKGTVHYLPYQQALGRYPQITKEECQEAVQLVLPNGTVYTGAHAILHALERTRKCHRVLWLYERLPLFGRVTEMIYQWVAHHRHGLSKLFRRPPTCSL